jgi:LysM repeat protein
MRAQVSLLKALFAVLLVMPLFLGTVTPVAAASVPTWHTVVRGETLFSIGRLYNVNPWAIASANKLANPNRIYVGQRLYIPAGSPYPWPQPCGSYYTVLRGDTLCRIGRIYGVSPWSIAAANRIYNMNYIRIGQRLFIPCR